jgi:hypothetical protein
VFAELVEQSECFRIGGSTEHHLSPDVMALLLERSDRTPESGLQRVSVRQGRAARWSITAKGRSPAYEHSCVQVLLGGEVAVQRAERDARLTAHVADLDVLILEVVEQCRRGIDDLVATTQLVGR